MDEGMATIDNPLFISKNPIDWALIYGTYANITVLNAIFDNISSRYATAVYVEGGALRIYNSKFRNLYANATAGAVGVKEGTGVVIQDCEFENVSSARNGGALYLDINGGYDGGYSLAPATVNATHFINCSSEFGGSILQLGGTLNVIGCEFIKNHAQFDGGAIYTSNASFYAADSIFDGNYIGYTGIDIYNGGALYLDYSSDVEIERCNFTNNTANEGGAIFLFDTAYEISNSEFMANGEAIHSYFDREGSFNKSCNLNGDKIIDNDEYYPYVVDFKGKEIVLNPISINATIDDAYFNLADFNALTPVKNQGHMGACWAFGANGALESAFLKATNITLDLSENNLQSAGIRYSYYGKPSLVEGGYLQCGCSYYLAWLGAVDTKYDTYDELGKISQVMFTRDSYHILDVVYVDTNNVTAVKDALLKYGGLTIFINGANQNNEFFNPVTSAAYCNDPNGANHYVTLVGWNDTFSKDNFNLTPHGDGAWICKNSWGTKFGDEGFYYLSYYDAPLSSSGYAIAYDINNTDIYSKVYQYDIAGLINFTPLESDEITYGNSYVSIGDDLIAAVGIYCENADSPYTIKIYVDGCEVHTQSGRSIFQGYQTVKLDKYVAVNEGERFDVEVHVEGCLIPTCADTRMKLKSGWSFARDDADIIDLVDDYGAVACIKAYTIDNLNVTCDVVQYFNPNKVEIASTLEGAVMTISQNGNQIASAAVKDGKAVFNVKVAPGSYVLTTTFNNTSIINILKIESTVKFTKTGTLSMDYNAGAKCKVKVVDSNGKAVKGKTVTFKINGKTYKKTTNSEGVVTLKITNAVTPGLYKLTANYDGQKISKTVKVKQTLKSAKTVSIKKSAKKLTLKATLKTSAGKAIKNKKVSFKLNGKTYSAKTSSKGIVKVTVKKSALNKLKAGKSYRVQITYLKDTIKTTLKVKG